MQTFFNQKSDLKLGKIIHIGAGACNELSDYIAQGFTDILLVEPNPKVFKQLQSKVAKLSAVHSDVNIALENVAVSGKQDEQSFYITQPHRYSSFYKAEQLKSLFQNLKAEQEITVKPLSLSMLIDKNSLDDNKNNTLVIQVNGAEHEVLSSLTDKKLLQFSSVNVQHAKRDCFEGAKSKTDLITLLEDKGFQLALEEKQDIVFGQLIFRKDESALKIASLNHKAAEQNKAHTSRITELESQLKESKANIETKASEVHKATEQNKVHTSRITELESQLKESKANIETKASEVHKATEQNKAHTSRITELESQLKESKASNQARGVEVNKSAEQSKAHTARITELESQLKSSNDATEQGLTNKLEGLMEQLQQQSQMMKKNQDGLIADINKNCNNAVKQIESFIGVQSYLETGELGMEYHGWPISSDIALFLLGKVEKNNYDLIIEFGSGTSTQLFAKAINNQVNNQVNNQNKHIDSDLTFIGRDKKGASDLDTLSLELPNRIVTFEHNKKYYKKTGAELEANKLSYLVDLVHAPLIEMKIENEDYLYYSCENKLSQLAAIYAERTARILVLIDGPPGATGPLARLPAVPLLLNYLGKHQLDIVLDDYNREEEKETVKRWKKQLEKRYFEFNEERVPCEKGAFFCRINP